MAHIFTSQFLKPNLPTYQIPRSSERRFESNARTLIQSQRVVASLTRRSRQVAAIPFPPRQLWSSEAVARARRAALEAFLRRLLAACAADARCALHRAPLSQHALVSFSPFFRKVRARLAHATHILSSGCSDSKEPKKRKDHSRGRDKSMTPYRITTTKFKKIKVIPVML